jgi:uncharacterized protein YjiS (DUF1127 family)
MASRNDPQFTLGEGERLPARRNVTVFVCRTLGRAWQPCVCCAAQSSESHYVVAWEDQSGDLMMGFFTELFMRPRPTEHDRYRAAMAVLNQMSNRDRADIGVKPADFPRIAREMTLK